MGGCRIRGRFLYPSIAESDFEVLLTNLLVFQTTYRYRFPPAAQSSSEHLRFRSTHFLIDSSPELALESNSAA